MSENKLGKSEMSTLTFSSKAMQKYIAPRASGVNVQDRIRIAARALGWSYTRTKDVWYEDPRVSINADELLQIEQSAGVKYGRAEVRSIDELIAKADALLEGPDPDFHRPFVDAFRAFVRALDRT